MLGMAIEARLDMICNVSMGSGNFAKRSQKGFQRTQLEKWCRLGDLNTRPHHYE